MTVSAMTSKCPAPYPVRANTRNFPAKLHKEHEDQCLGEDEKTARGVAAAQSVIDMLASNDPAPEPGLMPDTPSSSSFKNVNAHAESENSKKFPEFATVEEKFHKENFRVCWNARRDFQCGCFPGYGVAQELACAIITWLHNDPSTTGSCKLKMMELLSCMCGRDQALDNCILDRGMISILMDLMGNADAPICRVCLSVTGALSTVPDSDSKINRAGITPVIVSVIHKCESDHIVVAEAATCLAVMAMRTRHKIAIKKYLGVPELILKLKKMLGIKTVVVAVSRFVATYAVKPEYRLQLLQHDAVDTLITAFGMYHNDPEAQALVCRALWQSAIDSNEVQDRMMISGMTMNLAMALESNKDHIELYECSMGVLRRLAGQKQHHEEIMQLGFIPYIVHAIDMGSNENASSDKCDLLKESFGVIGNLGQVDWVRLQLGEAGVVSGIVAALKKCYSREDRKVVKLALASLSNLANSEENRDAFAECDCMATILLVSQYYCNNELILEYFIAVISHLVYHPKCFQQFVQAGGVAALFIFMEDHKRDLPILAQVQVYDQTKAIQDPQCTCSAVAGLMVRGGRDSGHQGMNQLKEAMEEFKFDPTIARDGSLTLLKMIEKYPALINTAMSLVNNLCMDMLRFHSDETSVVDAVEEKIKKLRKVSSLLAALPLEEKAEALLDGGFGQPMTQTLSAQRSSVPMG